MQQSARQVKTEIISRGRHGRQICSCAEPRIRSGKNFLKHLFLLVLRDDIEPDGEDICVLTIVLVRRVVGNQAILIIPAKDPYSLDGTLGCGTVGTRHLGIPKIIFKLCPILQGLDELQRYDRGASIVALRHSRIEILAPVHKGPPRQLSHQTVCPLALKIPIQYRTRAEDLGTNKAGITPVQPEVVHHADPQQRECWNHLYE